MTSIANPAGGIGSARLAYTMIRVSDLARSISFYRDVLGMTLFRKLDFPGGKFTLAFLGYGDASHGATVELTHNWGDHSYALGNGFGHIAIAVLDVRQAAKSAVLSGGKLIRPAGPMKGGTEIIAFLEDPDGYRIELVEDHHGSREVGDMPGDDLQ